MNIRMMALLSLVTSFSYADVNVNVKNFSIDYRDPKGSGSATLLNFDGHDHKGSFVVDKIADHVYFDYAGERVEWLDMQGLLKSAAEAKINNLSVSISNTGINTQVTQLNLAVDKNRTIVSNLSGNCSGAKPQSDFLQSLFGHCSKNGKLKFSSFEMQDFHKSLNLHEFSFSYLILSILRQVSTEEMMVKGGAPKMSNLDLTVNNNTFNGNVEVAMGVSAKVEFSGRFDLVENDTKLKIKLDKANVWIVSVADQIFKELAKIDGIVVNRPYIYVKLQ